MNQSICAIIILLVGIRFSTLPAQAQGTVYASNLGQASVGSYTVGSDFWLAESITAGTNSGGYALNSVELKMSMASGTPNGFSVSLYSINTSNGQPGSSLDVLSGSLNPAAAGTYTYTDSGITLSPDTSYFIVLASATPVATGAYDWSYANDSSSGAVFTDGWLYQTYYASNNNGLNWSLGRFHNPQIAITATAVPEPSAAMLLGLGGIVALGLSRWKASQAL